MRSRLWMVLGVFVSASLACGGLEELADAGSSGGYYVTAELSEPWTSLGLPIDGGNVFVSQSTAVTIQYNDGQLDTHYSRYRSFFENGGYDIIVEDVSGETLTVVYRKDDLQYALSGLVVMDVATITVGRTVL